MYSVENLSLILQKNRLQHRLTAHVSVREYVTLRKKKTHSRASRSVSLLNNKKVCVFGLNPPPVARFGCALELQTVGFVRSYPSVAFFGLLQRTLFSHGIAVIWLQAIDSCAFSSFAFRLAFTIYAGK
jgi:hypothetical protein